MTKTKTKRYALLIYRRRSYCKNIYINNNARYCFKSQLRLIKQKKYLKALLKRSVNEVKNLRKLFLLQITFTLT